MIRSIIIDDEVHCLDTLDMLIHDYCPEVEVMDKCISGKKALEAIGRIKPDLIFLDIEMPSMNGFELLEQFTSIPFSIVFTTSYDQYAIKAIRFSALDYLLKPIDPKELVAAMKPGKELRPRPRFFLKFPLELAVERQQLRHLGNAFRFPPPKPYAE